MNDFVIKIPIADDDLFDEVNPRPAPAALMWEDATDRAYLYSGADASEWPPAATTLGQWDETTGAPVGSIDPEYWTIAGLGNDNGRATGERDTVRWAGHPEAKWAEYDDTDPQNIVAERYPASNRPFTLKITREDYGSDAQPWDTNTTYAEGDFATSGGMWRSLQDNNQGNTPFGGSPFWEFINQSGPWGWRVDVISEDPLRDITARAISQHSAEPCDDGNFLFTTGAFVDDGQGNFFTECPPGNRAANADPVHFALRLGAGYEGYFTLEAPDDGSKTDALFWAADAP